MKIKGNQWLAKAKDKVSDIAGIDFHYFKFFAHKFIEISSTQFMRVDL
jgi:hypothetical protein